MKVIDLLNKKANGEELPKKIKYNNIIFSIRKDEDDYISENDTSFFDCFDLLDLNDELEIIEDTPKENKKIEKLNVLGEMNFISVFFKVNEIIDKINKGE